MASRPGPTVSTAVLCSSCGGRLARDNTGTVCSPCRRTDIEAVAHRGVTDRRDDPDIKAAFDSSGIYGVAEQLGCAPEDALDVLLNAQLLPFVSTNRRALLRELVGLQDLSHVTAGRVLKISRWTVAALRAQLGVERQSPGSTSAS
jgi:hypothetical protein